MSWDLKSGPLEEINLLNYRAMSHPHANIIFLLLIYFDILHQFFISVYVFVCVCVSVHTHLHVFSSYHLYYLRNGLSLALNLSDSALLADQKPRVSLSLPLQC